MATRWRVLNKRRRRQIEAEEKWKRFERLAQCSHQWEEEYYGTRCARCGLFYAHGCAPWDYYGDEVGTDYVAAWIDDPGDRAEDYDAIIMTKGAL